MQRPRGDLVAVNALWMVGHVQSVLACEIRLQSLNLQDFMAPRHEVHPDIFTLSGAWPGGPLGPLVAFRTDDRPGAPEAEGLQRARSVQLASAVTPLACSIQRSLPDPPTGLTGLWDHGLKRCPIAEAAFLEWWSLMESHSQAKVMARNVQLQESFGHATAEADGSRVSSILLCCIAGLLVLSKVESCVPRPVDQNKSGDWLPSCLAELLSTANSCWGALDLQHASTRQTLLVAKPLCQHLAVQGTGDEWQKFADFVEQCFSRKAETSGNALQSVVRKRCDVAGCSCVAVRRVHKQDAYGPAGFRCDRHKTALQSGVRRQCDVAGCTSVAVRWVRKHDAYGPAGLRCDHHRKRLPGVRRRCEVAGCTSKAGRLVLRDDVHGPAGFRCEVHGGRAICTVPGCKRSSSGIVCKADHLGPSGMRCKAHRAQRCTITGCHREAKCNSPEDLLGPAGRRCPQHSAVWPKVARHAV